MRAIQLRGRGGPEQLYFNEDAADPELQAGDAIIRVYACAVTPEELRWAATWEKRGGGRRVHPIPGHEVAGIVDRVPEMPEPLRALEGLEEGARSLKPGDEVYALGDVWRDGGAAEFMAIRASALAPKPARLNWVDAAAVPLAALTAWQGLRDRAHVSKGQRVLILDADNNVGMYAVQLAHAAEATVTAVVATRENTALLSRLGADEVIPAAGFDRKLGAVDVVFDTAGGEALEHSWKLLRRGGVLLTTAGSADPERAEALEVSAFQYIAEPSRDALIEIGRMIDQGRLRPVIEAVLPLREAQQAFELGLEEGDHGKIVLEIVPQRLRACSAGAE